MRVAQRMISRNYRRQVNSSLKKQADTLERSESGLKFKRLSDDVAAGSRAMHLQEERYQATQQLENTKDLIAEMKSVDSNMDSIHSVLQKVQERMLMGMSEDYGATAREVIAKEIHSAKEQILQFINNQFGGKYLFAGTNNSVQPFTEGEDGKLCFNGIPVALLAASNPVGVIFTGCFMSMLNIVGQQITSLTAYNEYITDVIIATIVYLSAFSLVIKLWLSGRKKRKAQAAAPVPAPAGDGKAEKGGEDA